MKNLKLKLKLNSIYGIQFYGIQFYGSNRKHAIINYTEEKLKELLINEK